ncbi:NADH:ubiquinone oxidoreductase [Flexivirga caeni]|uniref:NADH:ubiquinone oxidoreductase n=1 Tax=Flexivirga caeni TaxID=2294115 RepID=A0A3M9MIG6_9MICO|nr:NADH:ubiquinone oxidoreductase [Flexivirga caeni]
MPWLLRGLRDGVVTTGWPARPDDYFDQFPVTPVPTGQPITDTAGMDAAELEALCPTGAINVAADTITLDRGRCIACGRCVTQRPDLFAWRPGSDVARAERDMLIADAAPAAPLPRLRADIAERTTMLRRSVHIRHVDAGSDGSDEWEVRALLNPVYDVHRLGIFFTASPRHADILLITGIGSPGMILPLARTRAAMPDPVVVIATGTDAVSGGLVGPGMGVARLLPVDVFVPGAPAPPFALLHGILLALGRLPRGDS